MFVDDSVTYFSSALTLGPGSRRPLRCRRLNGSSPDSLDRPRYYEPPLARRRQGGKSLPSSSRARSVPLHLPADQTVVSTTTVGSRRGLEYRRRRSRSGRPSSLSPSVRTGAAFEHSTLDTRPSSRPTVRV